MHGFFMLSFVFVELDSFNCRVGCLPEELVLGSQLLKMLLFGALSRYHYWGSLLKVAFPPQFRTLLGSVSEVPSC